MATRIGNAQENGNEDYYDQEGQAKRRSTRIYPGVAAPYHGFVFKAFTRESLINIRRRKDSKTKKTTAYMDPAKPKLQPDPYLVSGLQLPLAFIRQLPPELVGRPIEDIDPYYADQETFVIISRGKELTRFSATKALYLFGPFHPIRRVVLYILVNPIFNLLVILTILANCILMTIQGSEMVERTEIIFTIIYTTEMGLKVLARGYIMDEFTYLRDPWNWLDFTVILMAYLTIVVEDLGNLSVIRTFRVLRALKTVAIIPGMKTIVGAVIDSVKNLKDVVVLTLFSLSVFSLLGLQIYMGQLTQKCILNGPNNMSDIQWHDWCSNSSYWVPEADDEIFGAYRLCGNATGAQSCPPEHTCLQGFGPNPDYGFTNFDTFGWSLICSFRLMTQDFWEGLYMQVLKTAGSWHIIFFIVSIFLGSIYLMNLILAIVSMSYNELQRRAEAEEEAAAEDEAAFLESCKLMEEQMSERSASTFGAHSSYRPSVEIGLVGQSLLANLCQNGLLGDYVRQKLNSQMMLPGVSAGSNVRSHSFSVNNHSIASSRVKRASMAPDYHYDHSSKLAHQASSLARLNGNRLSGSPTGSRSASRAQGTFLPPSPVSDKRTPNDVMIAEEPIVHHFPQYVSSGALASVRQSSSRRRRSARSSTTSDRDLTILRQRAAMIRIVSDDYSKDKSNKRLVQQGDDLTKEQDGSFSLDSYENGAAEERREAAFGAQSSSSTMRDDCPGHHHHHMHLNVNSKFRTQSQDYSAIGTSASGFFGSRVSRVRSEAAICEQPKSIHLSEPFEAGAVSSELAKQMPFIASIEPSPGEKTVAGSHNGLSRLAMSRPASPVKLAPLGGSTQTLHTPHRGSPPAHQPQQLGVERCLGSNKMHHLSVDNFQQFGSFRPPSALQTAPIGEQLPVEQQRPRGGPNVEEQQQSPEHLAQHRRRNRLESRGHIHPSTMARHSIARAPHRALALQPMASASGSRRMSQDFNRRASEWSRLSMSANVDLRRLLRLWSHTNPYQGRASIGSFSNTSQAQVPNQNHSPSHSIRDLEGRNYASQNNSPRPSSVGSARQAYELISALSRRHDLYPSDQRYAIPLDDNMIDSMSVNVRDKCLAYCLSCLDILCIWECCGLWIKMQRIISFLVFDPFTELFIILCILINTLFMALDSDDADAHMKSVFERGNYFFTATFAVEASMKIMALSPKFYFREGWNVFDSIIVGLSLLELGLEGVYGLSVLRSFRLLRVFKLAKSWPTLNLLISIMGKAVGDVGNLTFVLSIIVFIFAVMGMQLFGNKYVAQGFPSGELPRWNFTDFMHSFMIVFRILCAEWIEPMWDCLLVGGWPCIPFFLIAVTVGNLVVLNLFLALLLASFGASNLSSPQADNVDTKKLQEAIARFTRFGRWIRRKIGSLIRCLVGWPRQRRRVNRRRRSSVERPKKSHIAAMSKLERLKNIEQRTEELRRQIKHSPEHQHHLRALVKTQIKENARSRDSSIKAKPNVSYNYNYSQRHYSLNADREGTANGSNNSNSITMIPIIVNEASDGDNQDSTNDDQQQVVESRQEESCSMGSEAEQGLEQLADAELYSTESHNSLELYHSRLKDTLGYGSSSSGGQSSSAQAKPTGRHLANYARNMQPIKEDSRDADSSASLSELDSASKSLDKLAQDELSLCSVRCRVASAGDHSECRWREPEEEAVRRQLLHSDQVAASRPSRASGRAASRRSLDRVQAQVDEERPKSSLYLKAPNKQDMEEEDERALQHIETYIEKCIFIGILCLRWFIFRQYVRKIVEHRYFDQCILILIVISSGTLALEDKHLNERPNLKRTLDVLDTIFTIIFSLEMIFKWLAFGVKRYFGNIWSWLDFVIVLVSFVNLMASIFGSGKIQALKTMRTLRAMRGLRPLRALQRFQGMRVVVNALIQAIPSIFNVLLVCLIFWLIFSIMGVQMFGGKFWRCLNPVTLKVVSAEEAANKLECLERNLTWSNPQINFDNVLNAYLALFQVATFKGWIDIMNSASDSRARDDQPIREANIYMYFYFVFFVIFGSFFTLNLFIGVIIDNFNEQKKKTGGSLEIFMTDDQKKYYHAMKKMRSKRPVKAMTRPKFKLQAYMFDITTSKKFDMGIMLIIGLNMFVMALEHYGQSQEFSTKLENLNLVFIAIFTLECLCKIFAMRHFYFREPWNIFDFIVVDLSILGVVMKEYVAKYFVSPTLLRVVRVVKVGRVLRLVKGAKGIRTLLFALAMSLPALFNICLLLFLVMFIYAIFGMSFFMNVRPRAGIDETFNFHTFSSSIIVLFQMSTSAGWDLVLDPLMDEENDCQKPDPALGIEGTCGNKSIAIFYLISYVIVTFLIIINMYIAVILENYSQATEDVQEGLTDDDYEMYYEIWQKFDPDGTQYLPYSKLSDFVDALEDPLRIPKPNELALVVMDINIYQGDQCYCVDILDALTKYFFTRKGLVIQVNEHLQQVQSTLHETPFERITTTYLVKRENYCARIIQNCWRRWRDRVREASEARKAARAEQAEDGKSSLDEQQQQQQVGSSCAGFTASVERVSSFACQQQQQQQQRDKSLRELLMTMEVQRT